jgi:alpha-galactosidase
MNKKIVLVGAGSTSFGPASLTDLKFSKVLDGSTIVLHDIDKEKLEIIYDIVLEENKILENKYNFERTTNRADAFNGADFIISSIEVGDRSKLWRQDYEIPRKHGSTQILGECGGPGGSFHAFRIIPPILEIVRDAERICPDAFFINFSNPMARVCLAIKRMVKKLRFCGLCHQIGVMHRHVPPIIDDSLHPENLEGVGGLEKIKRWKEADNNIRMKVAGLNHFAFLIDAEDLRTGESLMPKFHERAMNYFKQHEDRFEFSTLTFEVYKRFGWFPYVGDNHLGEYLQFGEEFTKTQDMIDWIDQAEAGGNFIYKKILKAHKRHIEKRYPKRGMLPKVPTGERAIPIIEAIVQDSNSYEVAVNIPNDGIIDNLPQDLVVEVPITVNKDGVHGVKIGNINKGIASLLRIEASVQDLCVDAIINKSKEQAINALTIDPNVGSFEKAEAMFKEMMELQKEHLDYLK